MTILKNNSGMITSGLALLLSVCACSQSFDLQGHDPREYYSANPIENKVETKHAVLIAEFEGAERSLSAIHKNSLLENFNNINPNAVNVVTVHVPTKTINKNQRLSYVKKLLARSGFNAVVVENGDEDLADNQIMIDIAYSAVVLPDCPDWKKSPVTTYSNTMPANFGCATKVNLGLMVDNPKDLMSGRGSRVNEAMRGSKVLSDYRAGVEPASSSSAASASGQ